MCFELTSLSARTRLKDCYRLLKMDLFDFFFFTFKGSDPPPPPPTSGHGLNSRCPLGTQPSQAVVQVEDANVTEGVSGSCRGTRKTMTRARDLKIIVRQGVKWLTHIVAYQERMTTGNFGWSIKTGNRVKKVSNSSGTINN